MVCEKSSMSCLAPSEHYRACISITEMNRIEGGISHRTRSNIVCFSALKHQSRPSLSVYELWIQTEGHIDGYNTCKTFRICSFILLCSQNTNELEKWEQI